MVQLNEEQSMLRDSAQAWIRRNAPVTSFRAVRDKGTIEGFDPAIWHEMGQMGWAGLLIPEEFGGSGLGFMTLALLLEETGRTLCASPLFSTALMATSAIVLGGDQAQKETWLPQIAEGAIVATLAVDEGPHHMPETMALNAVKTATGWSLSGGKSFVADGGRAECLIVAARTSGSPRDADGVTLFVVKGDAAGLSRRALRSLDSRGVAHLQFDDVAVLDSDVLGSVDNGRELLDQVLDRGRVGLAAEMLGSASQAFEITTDYLKTRVQFGQPIGSFQALQHRAAKMFIELELARSCVEAALTAIDDDADDIAELASLAKAKVSEVYHLISNEMIQMHGGIGMTDDHDAGLYLKRARCTEAMLGSASYHRDRYAKLLGY